MDIENIISNYLNRNSSEEENIKLLKWLEESEDNRSFFKKKYDLWLSTNAVLTDNTELENALNQLKMRISNKKKNRVLPNVFLLRIAVSLFILFSTGYMGYKIGENKKTEIITYKQLLTGTDGKGEYVLPDGSTVWLNANSVLTYPEVFTGEKRIVRLDGEALFEVKKDKTKPFFVETGGMNIEVTGTRLLVNNYSIKNVVETILVNGSVQVGGAFFPESRLLKPGQRMTYNKRTKRTSLQEVNTDDYTNWIYPKLVFDNTNLAKIVVNLEKWFNVEIAADPDLVRNTHMSFTIRRESLDDVLTYMSLTAFIDYKWKDGVLHLSFKK